MFDTEEYTNKKPQGAEHAKRASKGHPAGSTIITDNEENFKGDNLNIPTNNEGYSLKLKKASNVSKNMLACMEKGYYPEAQLSLSLPQNTKDVVI